MDNYKEIENSELLSQGQLNSLQYMDDEKKL